MINDIRWHFCKDGDLHHVEYPTDEEYQQQHAAIVELYSEHGRIETHVYVKNKKE